MSIAKTIETTISKATAILNGCSVDSQGFMICPVCKQRKQIDITLFGKITRVPCICKCEEKADEEYQIRKKAEAKKEYVENLCINGFYNKCYLKNVFSNDMYSTSQTSKICRNYVTYFGEMYQNGYGLILYGNVGTGKTFYSVCIANALMDMGMSIAVTSLAELSNRMSANYGANRNEVLRCVENVDLLVLDDLGTERTTSTAMENIFSIINARYNVNKPMIISTNLSLANLSNPKTIDENRLYSRILEKCKYVLVENSARKSKGRESRTRIEELLNHEV